MNEALVLDPGCAFLTLEERLAGLGFHRDPAVRPFTADSIPGEPELAGWTHRGGEGRLTYTYNPVVALRVVEGRDLSPSTTAELSAHLPVLELDAIAHLLLEAPPRRILLGILAAQALSAYELAGSIDHLLEHPDGVIRRAAAGALEVLRPGGEAAARRDALGMMKALCEQAVPALAALVGPEGPAALEAMRPRAEDFPRVFATEVAQLARTAFEQAWKTPPIFQRLQDAELELRVQAAPAGMLGGPNELSRHFPEGYRALAQYLRSDRIWFTWQYLQPGAESGVRYDGVVRLDDRLVWFPRPYRVLGPLLPPARKHLGENSSD
jgi:hypothetical protein